MVFQVVPLIHIPFLVELVHRTGLHNPFKGKINNLVALRLSPYDKKLTNFIVNPDGQLEKEGKKITADHLIPVFKRQLTRLNWKHFKLTPYQGPKRGSKGLSPIALLMWH